MEEQEGLNVSFAGCGFLGLYYAGVAVCIKKYGAHLKFKHVSGASAGALAACTLLCDMSAEEYINDILEMVLEARNRTLGPFSPSFNLHEAIKKKLRKVLPQDAHVQVAGRLRVSLTRVRDGRNVIISDFKSRDELVDCLAASSFVPVFSGLVPPKFRGVRYIDGMFTDNLPRLHDDTITVSPFSGESDICPRDDSTPFFHVNFSNTSIAMSLRNLYHFSTILWPPAPEVLAEFCKMGFDDALRYLQRHNYISCTRCLSIQSTYVISEEECDDYDPQCDKCDAARQDAVAGVLPEVVDTIFQGYIDSANKGLYNWLLSHRGVRVISLLTLPYTIPIDCAYAFVVKVRDLLPQMVSNLKKMTDFLVGELLGVLEKMGSKGYKLSATLRMEYAIGGEAKGEDKHIKIDFHVDDRNLDVATLKAGKALSRRNSLKADDDFDTYDDILEVTSKHDAILAFYYTDENNKIRMTEIFDVTDCSHSCGIPAVDSHVRGIGAGSHLSEIARPHGGTVSDSHVTGTASDSHVSETDSGSHLSTIANAGQLVRGTASNSHVTGSASGPHVAGTATKSHVNGTASGSHVTGTASDSHLTGTASKSHIDITATDSHVPGTACDSHVTGTASDPHVAGAPTDLLVTGAASGSHASGIVDSNNDLDSENSQFPVLLQDKFENSDSSSVEEGKSDESEVVEAIFSLSPPVDIPGAEIRPESVEILPKNAS